MSRTDRHRPYWVKIADPFEQRYFWRHSYMGSGKPWEWQKTFFYRDCNCRMYGCCRTAWRRAENRQRRQLDQRNARNACKGNWLAWDERPYFWRG